jgi:lysophospholipase L1-like esterase
MAASPLLIRKNDRIVFLGDSITQAQMYTNYVETYLALRYPKLNLQFFNAGWGGDNTLTAFSRLDRDVVALKPTLVTISFGMNDGGYTMPTDEILRRYTQGLEEIVGRLKQLKIRILLLTPGAVDEDMSAVCKGAQYNARGLRMISDIALRFARKQKIPAFDMHKLMMGVNAAAKASDPGFTMIPDAVHPDSAGHMVMAFGLLNALGVPPLKSTASVSAKTRRAKSTGGLKAGQILADGDGLQLELVNSDRPFRIPAGAAKVLPFLPFQERFNNSTVAIRDLPKGEYVVRFGPNRSRVFSSEELAAGVNLAAVGESGELEVSGRIADAINDKNSVYMSLWRNQALGATHGEVYNRAIHRQAIALGSKLDALINQRIRSQPPARQRLQVFPAPASGEVIDNGDFLTRWSTTEPIVADFETDGPGSDIQWTPRRFDLSSLSNCLGSLFPNRDNCLAYARIHIHSPIAQPATLLLGSDDGFAAWLNGAQIGKNLHVQRGMSVDQERMSILLAEGTNLLLMKITQHIGGWGFCVRFDGLKKPVVAGSAQTAS